MKKVTSTADNSTDAMIDFLQQIETPTKSFELDGEVEIEAETEKGVRFYANFTEIDHEADESHPHSVSFESDPSQTEFWAEIELSY